MAHGKEENIKKFNYTKYEKARIIGARALQLSMGAPFLVALNNEDLEKLRFNPLEIAKKEFEAGVLQITVRRSQPRFDEAKEKKAE
ncbi:DNA-directed RNA polymerase subunit K [Candidatus Woesearchaeota archaeon]|nr:DNA-directed RNA polymerase subunit K [Candidatus Woesearchaeota archaeon]